MDTHLEPLLVALKSIDATLKELLALSKQKRAASMTKATATYVDLDGTHGNQKITARDPRDWSGPTMVGRRMSECPATYLDLLASRYDYFNQAEADEKKRSYNRLDAARARGWAERIRARSAPEPKAPEGFPSDMMNGDDISF